jgi:YegS/Rv2252/BmrU family lipid kinase
MTDEQKAVHIIINPRSGGGPKRLALAELRQALRAGGRTVVEYVTKAPADATTYAASVVDQASAVVAWGGDGTVREIAGALAGTLVPVLACPAGTENLLAKELKIPTDPRRMAAIIAADRTVECDLGVINGQNFMLIVGIGFDGEVVRRLASVRRGHITHLSYFWPIWRTFWEHDFPRMRVWADGEKVFDDHGMAFVGNISRYAVGLRICKQAQYDDGLLDMVVFTCPEQGMLLWHAAWTLLRWHPIKGLVLYRQFKRARIETDGAVPTEIDGDVGPNTPVDIAVRPGRLRLLVPPQRVPNGFWPWSGELPI